MRDARIPRVKVCGLTRAEDLLAAAGAGADAAGFVLHAASPRGVTLARASELAALAPAGIAIVLVLVDAPRGEVSRWARAARASAVQLCGGEDPSAWSGFELPILRRLAVGDGAREELLRWRSVAAGFVLDHPSGPGGTGRAVDDALARELALLAPCLLAGGLDETRVADAVARVGPCGVDASSRLESAPGVKDHARVRTFVARAIAALEARDVARGAAVHGGASAPATRDGAHGTGGAT